MNNPDFLDEEPGQHLATWPCVNFWKFLRQRKWDDDHRGTRYLSVGGTAGMGIWRSIFGWKALFRWDVLGAVVPGILIAIGIGLLSLDWFPNGLLIGQVCFAIAGILCAVKVVGHAIEQEGSKSNRAFFAVVLCASILGIDAYTLWVIEKHKEPKTAAPILGSTLSSTPNIPNSQSPAAAGKNARHAASTYNLDNVTEAIWFGFHGSSRGLAEQFREVGQSSLGLPPGANSINTVDNFPPETYDKAWASTFGKMLLCDPAKGVIGSGITVTVSRHPMIAVQIANSSSNGSPCRVAANLINAVHGYIPFGNIGQHVGYILDLPAKGNASGGDAFGLRFYLAGDVVREFAQGDLPQWKAFAIDDPNESIQLQLSRKGKEWVSIPNFEELLPQHLTVATDLMVGGPKIVRQFELVSKTPRQIARGDDASETFVWAFTWRRNRYSEEKSEFSGSN